MGKNKFLQLLIAELKMRVISVKKTFTKVTVFAVPYFMLLAGLLFGEGKYKAWVYVLPVLLVPIVVPILSAVSRIAAESRHDVNSYDFPVPRKRFTTVLDDEVMIEEKDIQEIIIYLSEVEDYAERHGFVERKRSVQSAEAEGASGQADKMELHDE